MRYNTSNAWGLRHATLRKNISVKLNFKPTVLGERFKNMTNINTTKVVDLVSTSEKVIEKGSEQDFNLNQIEGEDIRGKFGIGRIAAILDGQLSLPLFDKPNKIKNHLTQLEDNSSLSNRQEK